MPKSFTDAEREHIRHQFLDAGEECWERYGIKRTNVEDLTRAVGVAKGTFYLFFASKELFFMDVLERVQDRIKTRLLDAIAGKESPHARFVLAIMAMYEDLKNYTWLVRLMSGEGDYEYLLRKLPDERINQHIVKDDEHTAHLLALFGVFLADIQGDEDGRLKRLNLTSTVVSAALRGLFVMLLHQREVGEEQMDAVFQLLLEGLALRIFEEESV